MTTHTIYRLLAGLATAAAVVCGAPGLGLRSAYADRGLSSVYDTPPNDKGAGLIGLKVGAFLPQAFTSLGTSYFLELEGGYLLPWAHRLLGITGSFAVGMPETSGSGIADPRVPGGGFSYSQTTQQFMLGLTVIAKIPFGRFVPYVGVGPRLFIVRTPSSGTAADPNNAAIPQSDELSKEAGVGVPIGLDILLGPGRLFGEFQLLYAGSSQRSTGPANFGAMTGSIGYRFVL